jgi:hypothetical protein
MNANQENDPTRICSNTKLVWEPPTLTFQGRVEDLVRQGGGKLSVVGGDPGENRKQTGHDV